MDYYTFAVKAQNKIPEKNGLANKGHIKIVFYASIHIVSKSWESMSYKADCKRCQITS